MNSKGVLTVISGFSGAGKGTIMKELLRQYDCYGLSISATTRNPRPGEEHGREYLFLSREEFEAMIAEDKLLEHARYVDNYYGTPKEYVMNCLEAGTDVLLEIEIQGALQVKKKFPEAVLVFVTPPSAEELKKRLVSRGTETMEVINQRMARAIEESTWMGEYDYLLINDTLDECVRQLHELIQSQHYRGSQCGELIAQIQGELKLL